MVATLRRALAARPCEPFVVATSDGSAFTIADRESAAVLAKAGVLYVEVPGEADVRFIGLRHIKEVRAKSPVPAELPPFS